MSSEPVSADVRNPVFMKRGRISRVTDSNSTRGTNKYENANHIQVHYSGPSFSDLPAEIMHIILFKLPVKSVVVCKYVCKTWHDLISDPEFAKLHFDETCDRVHPVYHISDSKSECEKPYLVRSLDGGEFELKLGRCEHTYSNSGCVCNVKLALDTKFELPSLEHDDLRIVNSCNGLLCFSLGAHNAAVIICNPVLGEFISLPMDKKADDLYWDFINYGFGFSHVANKYKVVKIISKRQGRRATARVHIVGTEAWRDMSIEFPYFRRCRPIYVKGFIYWFAGPIPLPFFDVEKEYFGLAPGPKLKNLHFYEWSTFGVLAGELCMSFYAFYGTFQVWAMKGNGVEKTWSQVLSIDLVHGKRVDHPQFMKRLSDGSLLMFNVHGRALAVFDPIKCKFRCFNIGETKSKVKSFFAHVPSLISLRHSLSGNNTKVLDLRSRNAFWREELKWHKQTKDFQIYVMEA